ncbi:hypothetical protein OSTOST_10442, partial [Ostertagia ostertagi]
MERTISQEERWRQGHIKNAKAKLKRTGSGEIRPTTKNKPKSRSRWRTRTTVPCTCVEVPYATEKVQEYRIELRSRERGRLTFEPHAFRNILQSPKQLVIDKCTLPVVLPYTFTGLSHMQHLWFRNSTIDILSTHAFYHLTHVTYLYFRDVSFKRIEKKAFDALQSKQRMNPIGRMGQLHGMSKETNHSMVITICNCSIDRIRPSRATAMFRHDISLEFTQSRIGMVDSYAFANMSAQSLSFMGCVVGKVKRLAAANSRFDHVEISETRIESLDEGLFHDSQLRNLIIQRSSIAQVLSLAFQRSLINQMRVDGSDIGSLEMHALKGSTIHALTLEKATVNNVKGKPFKSAEINNLRIVDCKLQGAPARAFFSSLTTTRLSVINTTLDCDPDDCEMNSMFLKPPRHVLLWTFEGNSCRTPMISTTSGIAFCAQPTVFHQSGLTCRRSWAIADCVCTGSSASLPDLNASVVIIGDCEHLTVRSVNAPPHALYLFRIGRCDLVRMPRFTTALKIYHSTVVVHHRAFLNNHISALVLSYAVIHRVVSKAFVNVTIDEMVVSNSSLTNWHPKAVEGTKIEFASITDSRVGAVTSLLSSVRHLLVSNSVLAGTEGLSAIRDVHLSNNTVLCCCDVGENSCGKDRNMEQKCKDHFEYSIICDVSGYAYEMRISYFFFISFLLRL